LVDGFSLDQSARASFFLVRVKRENIEIQPQYLSLEKKKSLMERILLKIKGIFL